MKISKLASLLGGLVIVEEPQVKKDLQRMVGDPEDTAISTFTQFKPNPQTEQIPNPMSPISGDEAFYNYLIPESVFQAHDGSQWEIAEYDWDGRVSIFNVWYPHLQAQVSVNDVRRSIYAWIQPIQQIVPPAPAGVDYMSQTVKIKSGQ